MYENCADEGVYEEQIDSLSRDASSNSIFCIGRKQPSRREKKPQIHPELKPIEVHTAERLKHQVEEYMKKRIEHLEGLRDQVERVYQHRQEKSAAKYQ